MKKLYFNRHNPDPQRSKNVYVKKTVSDNDFILPTALAWISAVFFIIIVIFDLPVILRPHAVAVVSGIGEREAGIFGEEETDYNVFMEGNDNNVYVKYVAMGEERTSILKNAPKRLKKDDIVIVSYSLKDPFDVAVLRIYRYIFHAFVFLFCVIVFCYLWHHYNTQQFRDKLSSRTDRFF